MSIVVTAARPVLAVLLVISGLLPGMQAGAAEPVGDAKRIVNTVTGSGAVGSRSLAMEDPVYRNENISAARSSRGELLLLDGSRIIVGEDSTISLDDFAVSGSSFSKGTINVAKGAFRFISGGSAKEAIRIRTPQATIGVRGTMLDVYVEPETGATRTVLINGRITACTNSGECLTSRLACDVIEIKGRNQIQELPFLRSAGRTRADEAGMFALTESQQRHSPQWRVPEVGCIARAAEEARGRGAQNSGNQIQGVPAPPSPPDPPDDDDDCSECG